MTRPRLNHVLAADGKCLDVTVDHGFLNEPAVPSGIEDMKGSQKPPLVMRTDSDSIYDKELQRHVFGIVIEDAVVQALRLDAACTCANLLLPGEPEVQRSCVENINHLLTPQADAAGMPLMIEPLVMADNALAGGCMVNGNLGLKLQAVEMQADVVKADPMDDIDAIYRVVLHDLHADLYVDIIRAGKHLLGEKPFGIDLAAHDRIMAAVQVHQDVLARSSSEFPLFPGAQAMVKAVQGGAMGRIMVVRARFLQASDLDPNKTINWKRMIAKNGEYDCMGDLGLHVMHLSLRLGWESERVSARLMNVVQTRLQPLYCATPEEIAGSHRIVTNTLECAL